MTSGTWTAALWPGKICLASKRCCRKLQCPGYSAACVPRAALSIRAAPSSCVHRYSPTRIATACDSPAGQPTPLRRQWLQAAAVTRRAAAPPASATAGPILAAVVLHAAPAVRAALPEALATHAALLPGTRERSPHNGCDTRAFFTKNYQATGQPVLPHSCPMLRRPPA